MKPDFGTVPDWIAGIGAAAAFVIAAASYAWGRRRAVETRLAELRRERRAHAEQVTYYLEQVSSAVLTDEQVAETRTKRTPKDAGWFHYRDASGYDWGDLVLINNTGGSIYMVVACVPGSPLDGKTRGIGVIPPGETRVRMPMRPYPGDGSGAWTRRDGEFVNNELVPWVEFRDPAGITWPRAWVTDPARQIFDLG